MIERLKNMYLSPRQTFIVLAMFLAIILAGLIIYLLLFSAPQGFTEAGGEEVGGIGPLLVISGPGTGENPLFDRPLGVAVGSDGDIYVSDTGNDRIVVFDAKGRFEREFGGKGVAKPLPGAESTWEGGLLNFPLGLDLDDEDNLYVADFRNDQIQVFDQEGEFLRRFPDPNTSVGRGASGQEGLGIAVTDVAVSQGLVYALDTYQVMIFTTEGEYVNQFGRPGAEPQGLDHPNGIEVADNGTIYVSDSNHNRLTAFSPDGEVLWTLGEPITEVAKQVEYTFALPRGVTLLEDETLVVVDSFDHQLVRVSGDGEVLRRHGVRGTEAGQFNFPNGIDALDDRIFVADKENNRVQVLELLQE